MKKPQSVEERKSLIKPLKNINLVHKENLSHLEMVALWITKRVGTMGFFFVIFFWTIIWLGWNTLGPEESQFDPYPAFVLWLFISNVIQIFLLPLLLIGQNLQGKHAETRAEADYEVNLKSEQDIENIIVHLENISERLDRIENK